MHSYKIKAKLELALFFVFILSGSVQAQTVNAWNSASTSTAWLVNADWALGHVPTATEVAQFGSWPTAPSDSIAINFNSAVGSVVSGGVYHLSAIEVAAGRERDITIASNNAVVGTFVLSGATLNSTDNVIIRNDSAHLLTFKSPSGANNYTYNIGLANATDNIIRIDGAGGITIEANISDSDGGQRLSLTGSGSGMLILSGNNTYSGATTVSAGTLIVNGTIANSLVTVDSGAILSGNGVVSAGVAVEPGAALGAGPANNVGTLRLDRTHAAGPILTMAAGARFWFDLGPDNTSDAIEFWNYAGSSDLSLAGNGIDFTGAQPGTYTLFRFYSDAGTTATASGLTAGLDQSLFTGLDGYTVTLDYGSDAITLVIAPEGPQPVVITTQPASQTVTTGATVTLSVSATGGPLTYQWKKDGAVLDGATDSTLTITNAQAADAGTYSVEVVNSINTATSDDAILTVHDAPPTITAQPQDQAVVVGFTASLTVTAEGTAPLSYQWKKDEAVLDGATDATLTITNAQIADAGSYTVEVTNSAGAATSVAAVLTVSPPIAPAISVPPESMTVIAGQTVTLAVEAEGTMLIYQWNKDGMPIEGATSSTLTLTGVQPNDAGSYTITLSNDLGTITSAEAVLTVNADPGRLTNLSVRAKVGADAQTLIAGFVIAGSSAKSLLVRGAGPSLDQFGVTAPLPDPRLRIYNVQGSMLAENDSWPETLAPLFTELGAFAFTVGSKDAAYASPTLFTDGVYTAHVSGSAGVALVEIYDDDSLPVTSRLVNVSGRGQVGIGDDILIAGFVVGGSTPVTVLIRGVGPKLTDQGVTGVLTNPRLDVYRSADGISSKIASNDDWGTNDDTSAPDFTTAFTAVGAFELSTGSKDAALLMTLDPGIYTAQVSGVDNTTGIALVEVYAMP